MIRLLLLLVYPLLVVRGVVNRLLRRDPLRLARPSGTSSWVSRSAAPSLDNYFSESSGNAVQPSGGLAVVALTAIARRLAPSRLKPGEKFSAAADREQGIPDEVYTLW